MRKLETALECTIHDLESGESKNRIGKRNFDIPWNDFKNTTT